MGTYNRRLHYFALITVCSTFLLITAGALVTSNDAGLSVPDWPLSHGQLMPEMSGGVFYEHGHRLVAASVGVLTVILAVWLWSMERRVWVRRLGLAAVVTVLLQAGLGGIAVLFFLPTPVSVVHASLAHMFFCIVISLAVVTSRAWMDTPVRPFEAQQEMPKPLGRQLRLSTAATAAIFVQLVLGAIVRHAGTFEGTKAYLLVTWTLVVHLLGAVLVTVMVVATSLSLVKAVQTSLLTRLAYFKMSLLLLQWLLGVSAYMARVDVANRLQPTPGKVLVTTSHVAVGALLLGVALVLTLAIARQSIADDESSFVETSSLDRQIA